MPEPPKPIHPCWWGEWDLWEHPNPSIRAGVGECDLWEALNFSRFLFVYGVEYAIIDRLDVAMTLTYWLPGLFVSYNQVIVIWKNIC